MSNKIMPISEDDHWLECPVCKHNCISINEVAVLSGGGRGLTRINHIGLFADPRLKTNARGTIVTLRCFCEEGHSFDYKMSFHKGATYVEQIINDDVDYQGPIWRD